MARLPFWIALLVFGTLQFLPEEAKAQFCCQDWDFLDTGRHSTLGGAEAVTTDDAGNVYLAGYFKDTLFWHGQILVDTFAVDLFLAKYDAAGTPLWIRQISGGVSSGAISMETDRQGNLFVTGVGFSSVDIAPVMTVSTSVIARSFWLVKFDSNGNPIWGLMEGGNTPTPGGGQHPAETYGIALDDSGDVYLAAEISPSYILGGQVGWTTPMYGQQGAVIKYDGQNGNFLWMSHCGGPAGGFEYVQEVCIGSDGQVYAVGTFAYDGLFGPYTLPHGNDFNAFVTKLDAQTGNFLWVQDIGGTGWDEGSGIVADGLGHVYATGWIRGLAVLGPDTLIASSSNSEAWIARLDEGNGSIEWARQTFSNYFTFGVDVNYSSDHRLIVGGYSWDSLRVDSLEFFSVGRNDLYVLQLDSTGQAQCLTGLGGNLSEVMKSMHTDAQGRTYVAGAYQDSLLYQGQWIHSLNPGFSNSHYLLARLPWISDQVIDDGFCENNSTLLEARPGFAPYLWSTGDTLSSITVNQTGAYWVEYMAGNCLVRDSFFVSRYPLPSMNLGPDTVLSSGQSLTLDAGNPGSTYIWSTGDTTQTISVGPGSYGVTITNEYGCTTKDDIVILLITGRENLQAEARFQIWPQPSSDRVFMDWGHLPPRQACRIELRDLRGRRVRSYRNVRTWPFVFEKEEVPGIYFLQIFEENRLIFRGKIIWQ